MKSDVGSNSQKYHNFCQFWYEIPKFDKDKLGLSEFGMFFTILKGVFK